MTDCKKTIVVETVKQMMEIATDLFNELLINTKKQNLHNVNEIIEHIKFAEYLSKYGNKEYESMLTDYIHSIKNLMYEKIKLEKEIENISPHFDMDLWW